MHEGMPLAARHWDVHGRHVALIWFGRVTKSEPNIVPGYPGTSCMLWNMAFEYCTEPRARGPRFEYEYIGLDSLGFSWSPCSRCGSALGGERVEALEKALEESERALDAILSFEEDNLLVVNWHLNGDTEPLNNFFYENGLMEALEMVRAALKPAGGES